MTDANLILQPGDAVEVKTHNDDPGQSKMLFVNGEYVGVITEDDVERLRGKLVKEAA